MLKVPEPHEKGIVVDTDFDNANSSTHLAEWKKFMRKVQSGNEKKFPAELMTKFETDRTKLFQDWLKHGSFARVILHYRRKVTSFAS